MKKDTSIHHLYIRIYIKVIKCFSSYIPIEKIPNTLNEQDIDQVFDEIVNEKDFEKAGTERETYESIEELK